MPVALQQFDIAVTTILTPGEYGVIIGSSNPLNNGGISSSLATFSGGFALSLDSIFLNAGGVTIDECDVQQRDSHQQLQCCCWSGSKR